MRTAERNAAFAHNDCDSAELVVQVLGVADAYHMPVLLDECEDFLRGWTNFTALHS